VRSRLSMLCSVCNCEIPVERLEALPHTKTCVKCSTEPKNVGFMVYYHKTAPDMMVVRGDDKEGLRQARRADRRER